METLLSYSQAHQQLLSSFQTPTKTSNSTHSTNSAANSTSSASSASSSSPSSSMISPTSKSAFHQPITSSSASLNQSFDGFSHLSNPLYHNYHSHTMGNNNSRCTNSTILSPAAVAAAAAVAAEFHHNSFNYHSTPLVQNDFFKLFSSTPPTLGTSTLSLQAPNATTLSPLSISNLTNQNLPIASQPSSSSSLMNSIGLNSSGYSPSDETDSNGFYNSFVGRLASESCLI
jgi:hypothetical protein